MDDSDAARVRALGEILREFDLDAIRVKLGETEYELVRRDPQTVVVPAAAASVPVAGPAQTGDGAGAAVVAPSSAQRVTAPVVGVFYRAPSPDAEPFVEVGHRVAA